MLGDAKVDASGIVYDTKDSNVMYLDKDGEDKEINVSFFHILIDLLLYVLLLPAVMEPRIFLIWQISSAICFLRGKACEALENRAQARQWLVFLPND